MSLLPGFFPTLLSLRSWFGYRRRRWQLWFFGALLTVLFTTVPVQASPLLQLPGLSGSSGNSSYTLGWVQLDGYDVFQIAAPQATLSQRRQQIQQNLEAVSERYLDLANSVANVTAIDAAGQPEIYVNGEYLMTITQEDANLQGITASGLIKRLEQDIPAALERAYKERQSEYRQYQYLLIGAMTVLALMLMVVLSYLFDRFLAWSVSALRPSFNQGNLSDDQRHQLGSLQRRILPVLQGSLLVGTLLWALGRFPETRNFQENLLSALNVPILISIVIVVAYIGIRLTYAFVDKLAVGMTDEDGFSSNYSRRTRLRISTISSVIKNIANFLWIIVGFLLAASLTGVNLGLLLASVGIIGLALSLAAQNLVQGAIKGFFIVLEDQFAIGDVVEIGEHAGIVENLNLRITQLRDTGGRMITIPTSDITRVANYSLHWSRADLKIPVHYHSDINQMLDIIREVGQELQSDTRMGNLILEEPQILGVDDFNDSSIIVRVWIKTKPMKQWDVAREYRRRFKQRLQDSDTSIPFPQRDVWLHPIGELSVNLQGSLESYSGNQTGNGSSTSKTATVARTDAQPRNASGDEDVKDLDGGGTDRGDADEAGD